MFAWSYTCVRISSQKWQIYNPFPGWSDGTWFDCKHFNAGFAFRDMRGREKSIWIYFGSRPRLAFKAPHTQCSEGNRSGRCFGANYARPVWNIFRLGVIAFVGSLNDWILGNVHWVWEKWGPTCSAYCFTNCTLNGLWWGEESIRSMRWPLHSGPWLRALRSMGLCRRQSGTRAETTRKWGMTDRVYRGIVMWWGGGGKGFLMGSSKSWDWRRRVGSGRFPSTLYQGFSFQGIYGRRGHRPGARIFAWSWYLHQFAGRRNSGGRSKLWSSKLQESESVPEVWWFMWFLPNSHCCAPCSAEKTRSKKPFKLKSSNGMWNWLPSIDDIEGDELRS